MKVALYARVSMDEAAEDRRFQDPENQLEPLRNWAKTMGWEVFGEYVDKASGANPNRDDFRRIMADALQCKFQAILVWKLDRFSREGISQVFAYLERLRGRGIAMKSMTEQWMDTSKENPLAEVTLAVIAWASAYERQKISERTKAGIQRLKNIDQWKGGRPRRALTPQDHESLTIWREEGLSSKKMATRLKVSLSTVELWLKGGDVSVPLISPPN